MLSLTCDPIAMALMGLVGVLVGLIELGLGFVRRFPTWGISLGLVGLLAAGGGVGYAAGEGVMVGQPLLVLAGVSLTLLLFRSKQSIAGRPVVQGAGMVVLSAALLGYAIHRIDQGLENELTGTDFALAQMADPLDEGSAAAFTATTDGGRSIPLFMASASAVPAGPDAETRFLRDLKLEKKLIQTAPADLRYNCHGWVFTGGQFWLRSAMVEAVLADNSYVAVKQPLSGDVAVFRNAVGEVTHTGLVRASGKDGGVLIESKWGRFGRYVHGPDEHGYRGQNVTYYRTTRGTHLLKGLEPAVYASDEENR
jgi:hypothetical protein